MPRACSICRHPQREEIEAALAGGGSLRNAAQRYGTSATAVHRHQKHAAKVDAARSGHDLPAALRMAEEAKDEGLPPLTPREEKLVTLLAQGDLTIAEACRQCGFSQGGSTYERIRRGDIRQHIRSRMESLGLVAVLPLLKIREMYDAKKEVSTKTGEVVELVDNDAQRWAAEQTLRLLSAYPKAVEEEPERDGAKVSQIIFSVKQTGNAPATERESTTLVRFLRRQG